MPDPDSLPLPTLDAFGEAELLDLDDRVAHVLRMRSGMVDGKAHSLDEVGDELSITGERVRQIQNQGLLLIRQLREVQRHLRKKPSITKLWKTRW
ncbi:MAG: sigma factor-like helix-turn-helix DNA-binding protein [Solirubrobacterales bacterium]